MVRPQTIVLQDVTLGYNGCPAVSHVSGTILPGTLLAVVGPNGGGKSTLIKALAGLLRPLGGRIDGLAGQRVAYLPQQTTLERGFPITVGEFAAMGLWHEVGAFGGFRSGQRRRVYEALEVVGLEGHAHVSIDRLSGGQLQRTLFARLILQDAPLLLLDEPFAAIDQRTTADLLDILRGWHSRGKTVLAVMHDLHQVRAAFPETLMLEGEPTAWGPTARVLAPANLRPTRVLSGDSDERIEVGVIPERLTVRVYPDFEAHRHDLDAGHAQIQSIGGSGIGSWAAVFPEGARHPNR